MKITEKLMHLKYNFRNWLIFKLANGAPIVMNVKIIGGICIYWGDHGALIRSVEFDGKSTPIACVSITARDGSSHKKIF